MKKVTGIHGEDFMGSKSSSTSSGLAAVEGNEIRILSMDSMKLLVTEIVLVKNHKYGVFQLFSVKGPSSNSLHHKILMHFQVN